MKQPDMLLAGNLTILALLVIIALVPAMSAPNAARLASTSSPATPTPGCPPRPTRAPAAVPTFRDTPQPPTAAPPPTAGPPRIETPAPVPTLVHPLETEEEILRVVLNSDLNSAEWDDPWCLETPRLQPDRITFQWYPNETAYNGASPPSDYGQDPIWVVTIKGNVKLSMICMACTGPIRAGGVTYMVNQKTGMVFGMGTLQSP